MNISTIAFILIAALGAGSLVLVVGGLLVRSDIHRAALPRSGRLYPPFRVLHDLRPVQDLVVDFVAASLPSSELLDFLATQTNPVSIIQLRANLPFRAEKLWTAVFITGVAGLIRFGRDGVTITGAGWAVRARLNGGRLRKPIATASDLSENRLARSGAASPRQVSISVADHQELSAAIAAARKLAVLSAETRPLQDKLMRARVRGANDVPHDLITMNSRAEFVDLETTERVTLGLVYPADADIAAGRISVFHPLGAAMLGHRVGQEFEWSVPYGTRRFKVTAVQFQPEAALAMAA